MFCHLVDKGDTLSDICPSSHGGGGYAIGSYWDGDDIICGCCGYRIANPPPTGGRWIRANGFWQGQILGKGHWEPKWPDWLGGQKGVKIVRP